ncbi:MAG TPA: SGNH/GDSL hydrolase family protein [Polyangiaceae bacterium]|nr:SGNH/GDSL hydrolase family protein [Polyangiaceae bacterium]
MLGSRLAHGLLLALGLAACIVPKGAPSPPSAPEGSRSALAASAAGAPKPEPADAFPLLGETCRAASTAKLDFSWVRVDGRSETSETGGLRFSWSGTALSFRFRGPQFQLELEDSGRNWFGVTLDGVDAKQKLSAYAGRRCYLVANHLAAGEHRVTITRLTEAMLGDSALLGANAGASGEILAPDARPTRRLEVIGDSITAAYGVEGENRYCHFSPETENQALSYAAVLARRFNAELSTVAWSGKGIFSNRGSTSDTIPMPVLWERTLPLHDDSHWDFSSWLPDAVVIDLGTNDFAAENPDKGPFAEAYRVFLVRVRAVYPNAVLFCALSPLLSDQWPPGAHSRSQARAGIQTAIDALKRQGDARVFYVEHQLTSDAEGWGCDWHPSRATQARMADELTAPLAKNLGW